MQNGEGDSIRPDVIIHLPDKKHIIIDSKLSLIAYERFVNAETDDDRAFALKEHIASMKQHIIRLFDKKYSSSRDINTPDFVLMFIPVEASFAAAVESDSDLFGFAWEKKIIPVSPSTLLATLRTIASIWKQENQNRNAMEIAQQGGMMYDKLVSFLQDLEKVGKSINQLHDQYEGAMNKISTGKGNLITRAAKIKELGAKTSKEIPVQFLTDESEE
jgi:DNA recombination protein RmuC